MSCAAVEKWQGMELLVGCLCRGTWGPRETPVLAVVCKGVLLAHPSPDADQEVNISFWSLKLVVFL